jgi:hypothetical protein
VIDILSLECRAALNRCYLAVWCLLLPHLANRYQLSEESIAFHRFWHLDQCQPTNDHGGLFHLFHGHTFALHPGAGLLLLTKTGSELMGQWLTKPVAGHAFERLLHAMCTAMGKYSEFANAIKILHKKDSASVTDWNLETAIADEEHRSHRRCLRGVRDDFDDPR